MDDFKTEQAVDEIDKQIDAWEEYKKKWDDVSKDFETSQNKIIATQTLGNDVESKILAQRLDIWNTWQKKYIEILTQIENATSQFNTNQASQFQQSLGLLQTTTPTYRVTTSNTSVRGQTYHASGTPFVGNKKIAHIDEHGEELIVRNPQHSRLTFLQKGDGVLNTRLTRNIMDFANKPDLSIQNVLGRILANHRKELTADGYKQVINIANINLPNVNNPNQFIKQLQLISQNH